MVLAKTLILMVVLDSLNVIEACFNGVVHSRKHFFMSLNVNKNLALSLASHQFQLLKHKFSL